jgi:hypothetical protein
VSGGNEEALVPAGMAPPFLEFVARMAGLGHVWSLSGSQSALGGEGVDLID